MPITRKKQWLFKLESSEGQDASPGAADAVEVFDLELSDGPELLDRVPAGPSLSRGFRTLGLNRAEVTNRSEFRGSGDTSIPIVEPDWGRFVQTSGMLKVQPIALTLGSPSAGTGVQVGEVLQQGGGTTRGVVLGCFAAGVPVRRLTGTGTAVVVPILGTFASAPTPTIGESSATTASCTATASYAGVAYKLTSRKLFNVITAAACAVAVGEVVKIERAGVVVGAAQLILNNSGFTNVDMTLLYGEVANGDTVRAAAGGTTTISTGPTQTETPSGTGQANEDGEQSKYFGMRADWTLGGGAGEALMFNWTLRGDVGPVVDALPVTGASLPTIVAPQFRDALCIYGRGAEIYALPTKEMQLAMGAQVEPNRDANRAGGSTGSNVIDRVPALTATVDRTHSAFPWRAMRDSGEAARVAYVLGKTPGNIMSIVCPRLQVSEVSRNDATGIAAWALTLNPARILESGDDDVWLAQL